MKVNLIVSPLMIVNEWYILVQYESVLQEKQPQHKPNALYEPYM